MKTIFALMLLVTLSFSLGAAASETIREIEKARSVCSEKAKNVSKEKQTKSFQDCMNNQNLKGQHGHGVTFYEDGTEIHWLNPKKEAQKSTDGEEK